MQTKRFLLIVFLFLIPTLIYGLEEKRLYNDLSSEWKKHSELIEQINKLNETEKEKAIQLLNASLQCCRNALRDCETILGHISNKSKKQRKEERWVELKNACEEHKKNINAEITQIQTAIQNIQTNIAFDKANLLYQQSIEKAAEANSINQNCQRKLNNIDEVILVLNQAAKLYEEAASLTYQALNLITPFSNEANKNILKQAADSYQELANKFKKEASNWPEKVIFQKKDIEKQISTLKEDSELFASKGLKRSCYDLQKQAIPLLEQLIESSTNHEKKAYEEELGHLKESIAIFEKEADESRQSDFTPTISKQEFKDIEKQKKELFFKNPNFFNTFSNNFSNQIISLDEIDKKENDFTLFIQQYYHFSIQSEKRLNDLVIKVFDENKNFIYEEKMILPIEDTASWEKYLNDGMIFIPENLLKSKYG